jgi:alpha-1,2-mannosyltransferase
LSDNIDLLSVYLWIGIFIIQPHKEERFMYVIFPLICYNAARSIVTVICLVKTLFHLKDDSPTYQIIAKALKSFFLLVFVMLSLARVLAQWRAYSAPMHVYKGVTDGSSVCLGKEWYRFPSSFFLEENSETFFVKSEFSGLLPGKFPRSAGDMSRNGTWLVPTTMNDQNLEELSHTVRPYLYSIDHIGSCRFLRLYGGF